MFKRKRKNDGRRSRRILLLLLNILALVVLAALIGSRPAQPAPDLTEQAATAALTGGNIACDDLDGLVNALEAGGDWTFNCRAMVYMPKIIVVAHDTTLTGNSDFLTMLSGRNAQEAVIWVENGATLTLNNIHITEATRYGIYVTSGSKLVMDTCRFSDIGSGVGGQDGAALWNDGMADLNRCTFEYNYGATNISGAVFSSPDAVTLLRDSQLVRNHVGVYSHGKLVLDHTQIDDNDVNCVARREVTDPDGVCRK